MSGPGSEGGSTVLTIVIIAAGIAVSCVTWNKLPQPGNGGRLILSMIIMLSTIWFLSNGPRRYNQQVKVRLLVIFVLIVQVAMQASVWLLLHR